MRTSVQRKEQIQETAQIDIGGAGGPGLPTRSTIGTKLAKHMEEADGS